MIICEQRTVKMLCQKFPEDLGDTLTGFTYTDIELSS